MSDSDGVPQWLSDLGVQKGEWFIDSKLRAKRAMKSACFSGPARIHIYLGLATMGYQQELAVKMEAGKRVPVQPSDVCAATGIDRRHFRRIMSCLEAYGLAKVQGWTKGRVQIYAWAVPRPVQADQIVTNLVTISQSAISPEINNILKRYRIRIPADFVTDPVTILEIERLAQVTKAAELSLRQYIDCHRNGRAYKDERNESNFERKPPPPSSSTASSSEPEKQEEEEPTQALVVKAPDPEPPPPFEVFQANYPGRIDPASKPAFEGLNSEDKVKVVAALPLFRACEVWQTKPRFIPYASNFIRKRYWEFPVPKDELAENPEIVKYRNRAQMVMAMMGARRGDKT